MRRCYAVTTRDSLAIDSEREFMQYRFDHALVAFCIMLSGCSAQTTLTTNRVVSYPISPGGTMQITSSAFAHNTPIPDLYTCNGKDINPPLDIVAIPAGAGSLVLVFHVAE